MKKVLVGCGCLFFVGIAIASVIIIVVLVGKEVEKDDNDENNIEEINDETNEQEENNTNDDEEEAEEVEEESTLIEHKDLLFGEFTIDNLSTETVGDELVLSFHWINQSGEDKMPFTVLGFIDVIQGDELLKETTGAYDIGNKSSILFRNALGGRHSVTMKYGLVNDEPIEITFGSTLEVVKEREAITIDLE